MSREVEVAVGGSIPRRAPVCDACGESMLFRCPDGVTPVAAFCQNYRCRLWLWQVEMDPEAA